MNRQAGGLPYIARTSSVAQFAASRPGGFPILSRAARRQAAFTMVEIALCIAIIGFALVAIIGVLPTGMRVQKDNREDTIINQDGTFLLEAIRSGSQGTGLDELTTYFEKIIYFDPIAMKVVTQTYGFGPTNFSTGREIIGLISRPNLVSTSEVRSISGALGDKGTNVLSKDLAFKYQLRTEITPIVFTNVVPAGGKLVTTFSTNLYDLRLNFRWPLLPNGIIAGDSHKTFRMQIASELVESPANSGYYFFFPQTFTP